MFNVVNSDLLSKSFPPEQETDFFFKEEKVFDRVPNTHKSQKYLCSELNLKVFSGYCVLVENISLKFVVLQRTSYLALFFRIFCMQYSKLFPPKKYILVFCEKAE